MFLPSLADLAFVHSFLCQGVLASSFACEDNLTSIDQVKEACSHRFSVAGRGLGPGHGLTTGEPFPGHGVSDQQGKGPGHGLLASLFVAGGGVGPGLGFPC